MQVLSSHWPLRKPLLDKKKRRTEAPISGEKGSAASRAKISASPITGGWIEEAQNGTNFLLGHIFHPLS
jgi:hypothetical protein